MLAVVQSRRNPPRPFWRGRVGARDSGWAGGAWTARPPDLTPNARSLYRPDRSRLFELRTADLRLTGGRGGAPCCALTRTSWEGPLSHHQHDRVGWCAAPSPQAFVASTDHRNMRKNSVIAAGWPAGFRQEVAGALQADPGEIVWLQSMPSVEEYLMGPHPPIALIVLSPKSEKLMRCPWPSSSSVLRRVSRS
jgi:hypothetical protein